MHEHRLHPQRVGHCAGVLPPGAAETLQRVAGDVIAALDGDFLDRVRHVLDRDAEEPFGEVFGRPLGLARLRRDLFPHRREFLADDIGVERLIAVRAENRREMRRLQLAKHDVAVRHRQRPAAPVAGRAGIGAGAVRTDLKATVLEEEDRPAARRDRVNVHHRRAHPDARDLGLERPLIGARIMANVGGGAAHVEADQLVIAGQFAGLHHADHAPSRAGQNRVLALKQLGVGQPAIGLHEHQAAFAAKRILHLVHIAAEDRRQISVHHGRIPAGDQLHQRRSLVGDADLAEPFLRRDGGDASLVVWVQITVHEGDGDAVYSVSLGGAEGGAGAIFIQFGDDIPFGVQPLINLCDPFIKQFRQGDLKVKELRPRLMADPEKIAKPLGDEEERAVPLPFQQRIGGDGGAHLHRFDGVRRHGVAISQPQHLTNALHGGVLVAFRVLRKQLVRRQRPIRTLRHDVGEGAAAVDPELPHDKSLLLRALARRFSQVAWLSKPDLATRVRFRGRSAESRSLRTWL